MRGDVVRPIRFSTAAIALLLSGLPSRPPGNTNSLVCAWRISPAMASARADKGTRCSRLAFIREPGIVHTSPSTSSHFAPITSPVQVTVQPDESRISVLTSGMPQGSKVPLK